MEIRDKVDEVFDLDEDIGRTAAQELDAEFNDSSKCFSFSLNKPGLSMSGKQEFHKNNSVISKISRQSLALPEIDFDESLNMRDSNGASDSAEINKDAQLFKANSIHDSEKDKRSGHFQTSPQQ